MPIFSGTAGLYFGPGEIILGVAKDGCCSLTIRAAQKQAGNKRPALHKRNRNSHALGGEACKGDQGLLHS